MSFSDWKEYRLEEVTESLNNKRVPLSSKQRLIKQGKYPYYGAQGIIDYIDDYSLEGEYLLVAEDGANLETRNENIARLTGMKEKFWVNNHAHILRANSRSDIRFVKYFLNKTDISGYVTGSAQPKLNKANLSSIKICLPPLEEQKSIAHILSTIDEKIETNNQINKKLEEMAQAIFKQWFIDFEFPNKDGEPYKSSGGEMIESELGMIPKGWEVSNLEEIIHFNPRESLSKNSTYKFIEMAALSNFSCDIQYWEIKKFNGGSKFRNGDILLARITPCLENGKTAFVDVLEENEIGFGSTEFIVMREKEVSNKYYIYCLARDNNFRAHAIKSMSGSSGRQRVQIDLLTNYKIARAPKYIYHSFGNVLDSLFKNISNNNKEIEKLRRLRDTLLPKLMSGEIRVPLDN